MRKLKLLLAACALTGASAVWAQTDVTSTYLKNADFSEGTPITVGVCTYEKDKGGNGTEYAQLVPVDEWDIPVNGDGRAGGLVAFGSGVWIGGAGYLAPETNSDGEAIGNILGIVGVWDAVAQYTQNVTLPAGTYTMVIGVYNSIGGTVAIQKNLIGFIEDAGTEHLATTTNYSVNTWKYEFITFALEAETTGKVSLGYDAVNKGSADMPHLFLSGLQLFEGEVDAVAYEAEKEKQRNAKELALNKEKLAGASNTEPSADLLVNGSFDTANQGWTLTNMGYKLNEERPTRYVEKWSGGALSGSGSATQTIKNLPAGYYVLNGTVNAQLQSDQSLEITGVTLSVNGETVSPSGPWKEYEIAYNHQADGDIAVTFAFNGTNANWVSIDGFSLIYIGETYDEALYQDAKLKKDWATANQAAVDALANDNYKNVTGDERTALQTEAGKEEPSVGNYKDAIDDLNAAIKTFTDAKSSYDALVAANNAVENLADLPYADRSKKPSETGSANTAEGAAAAANAVYKTLRIYYESNAMAEGVDGAVNMTERISDPDFEGVTIDGTKAGAWTFDQTGGTVGIPNSEPFTDANDNSSHSYFDYYNNNNNNQNVHQDIADLAPGRYLLSVTGRGDANFSGNLHLYVVGIDDNTKIPAIGNTGGIFGRGWNDVSLEFELSTTQTITIGVKTDNGKSGWWGVSRFRLVQLEAVELSEPADQDDYTALSNAISTAEKYTLGFEKGQYAPYNNVAALEALAAAKAINPEEENDKAVVNQVAETLTSASWTANTSEVNAIYDGQFAHTEANTESGKINLPGWTKVNGIRLLVKDEETDPGLAYTNGKAAVFSWGGTTLTYGEQAGYTLPMAKYELYELTLKVSGWRDGDQPSWFSVELDGKKQVVTPSTKPINTTDGNPFDEQKFYLTPTVDNSILKIYGNKHFTIADLTLVKATTPVTVTVGDDGYATYVAKAPLDFSTTSIKAYTAKVDGDKVVLTQIKKVATGTPVVLYCEGGKTEVIPFASETDTPAESDLVAGNSGEVKTEDGDYTNYILNNAKGIGFYYANGMTVAREHAYLHVNGGSTARLQIVFEGEATAISEVKSTANGEAVYNLSGQRVNSPKKGLYIIGGKKAVLK